MNKEQGNKLINEYLGTPNSSRTYHNNWEYLMPLTEKIERKPIYGSYPKLIIQFQDTSTLYGYYWKIEVGIMKNITNDKLYFQTEIEPNKRDKNKITATFNACIAFIQWYNQLQTKN